jgi:DNA polymerase-3 subunit gamma/tau
LNEAQINYKQARNKRLHLELALIKLCYLQQALQLVNSDAGIGKKKLIDSPVAFKVTPIRPFRPTQQHIAEKKNGEDLYGIKQVTSSKLPSENRHQEAKLMVDTSTKSVVHTNTAVEETIRPYQSITSPANNSPGNKLSSLDKIRKQVSTANGGATSQAAKQLTDEDLHQAWGLFTVKLREAKNHASQSLAMAELRITDDNSFTIVVPNNIQQRFIESVRLELLEFLQLHFNNKSLSFTILLEEKQIETDSSSTPLTRKEQYLKIIEQYPLVKEMKDRLKLELDY